MEETHLSDTFERDNREDMQPAGPESAATPAEEAEVAQKTANVSETAAEMTNEPVEAAEPAQDDSAAAQTPVVTAVQFPRIDLDDIEEAPAPTAETHAENAQGDAAPDAVEDIPLEEEDLPLLEDDAPQDKGKLYNFVAKMDDVQFRRAQAIFGAVIGLLAGLCLYIPIPGANGGSSMWNFVIALIIAMWIPRIVERKVERRMPVVQKWMLIVFVLVMVVLLIVFSSLGGGFGIVGSTSPSPSAGPTPTPAP